MCTAATAVPATLVVLIPPLFKSMGRAKEKGERIERICETEKIKQ